MKFLLPVREDGTHKGQNGKVLVIGGNRYYHGAPILAALGVERAGVDLIYLMVPEVHKVPARMSSFNFIVHSLKNDHLNTKDLRNVSKLLREVDVVLVGNGIGQKEQTKAAVVHILEKARGPVVLDAEGLFPEVLEAKRSSELILMPHVKEFTRLFRCSASRNNVVKMARQYGVSMLLSGAVDLIVDSEGTMVENKTGVSQMTVGGTGDVLSGIVAGFVARGLASREALISAAYYWGRCGEVLAKKRFSFTAQEMLEVFSEVLLDR